MSTEEEEKYFHQQELERRKDKRRQLERAASEAAERRKVAATLATDDESLIARIRELGFDGDTARVLDLLPLVHVAWADGSVSANERRAISSILAQREIAAGSEGALLIEALMDERPSDTFLSETLDLLRALGGTKGASVVDLCIQVADASGGLFGLGEKISDEERALIAEIAAGLGDTAHSKFSESL